MIGYVTLGTNDFDKAVAFYDEGLGVIGARRVMENERLVGWATGGAGGMLAIVKPYDEGEACVGNGVMPAISVSSREDVDKLYAKALELGGKDEGAPGLRGETFYGGYFRDLDGNKLVAYIMG